MKKTVFFVTILMLTLCVTFAGISVNAYSIEENYDILTEEKHLQYLGEALDESTDYATSISTYDNYLQAYFDNLTYNLGMNYKGSCGYVAIGMMLSYYDTYYNDNIIPETYDIVSNGSETDMISRRNSPGIMRDIIANPNSLGSSSYGYYLTANEYYSSIMSIQNTSMHAKLITIGASYGYYDFSDDNNPAGTNFNIRFNVINNYFSNILGYGTADYSLSYINREGMPSKSSEVRNFAIQEVQKGNPVLLSIGGPAGGHVVVAYDYDSDNDNLYCHFGWGANRTHRTMESEGFNVYKTALVFNFNGQHAHSNNYAVTTIESNIPTTEYYCYDDPDILTYATHVHQFVYRPVDSNFHIQKCSCGETQGQKSRHIIDGNYIDPIGNGRYKPCAHCGYLIDTFIGGIFPVLRNNNISYVTFTNGIANYYDSIEQYCLLNGLQIVNSVEQLNAIINEEVKK